MRLTMKPNFRMLAGAALVALTVAVAGTAVSPAGAERNTLCSATGSTLFPPSDLDYEFFNEGELMSMKDPSGTIRTMRCGEGGTWQSTYPSRGPRGGVNVRDTPGGRRR